MVKTPNLDRLASAGRPVRSRVHAVSAVQSEPRLAHDRPAPDTIRVYDLQTEFRTVMPDVVTLPQMFKRNGYVAARVGKIYHYGNPGQIGTSGLDDPASWDAVVNPRGIDKDEETRAHEPTRRRGARQRARRTTPRRRRTKQHTDGKVAPETIALLEKNRDRPFFIGAGFYRPHCPFIAPQQVLRPVSAG